MAPPRKPSRIARSPSEAQGIYSGVWGAMTSFVPFMEGGGTKVLEVVSGEQFDIAGTGTLEEGWQNESSYFDTNSIEPRPWGPAYDFSPAGVSGIIGDRDRYLDIETNGRTLTAGNGFILAGVWRYGQTGDNAERMFLYDNIAAPLVNAWFYEDAGQHDIYLNGSLALSNVNAGTNLAHNVYGQYWNDNRGENRSAVYSNGSLDAGSSTAYAPIARTGYRIAGGRSLALSWRGPYHFFATFEGLPEHVAARLTEQDFGWMERKQVFGWSVPAAPPAGGDIPIFAHHYKMLAGAS